MREVIKKLVTFPPAAAFLVATLTGTALLSFFGHSPWQAGSVFLMGAFGDAYAVSETLLKSIPLLFAALAVSIAFRAGIWNIGADGQFIIGAVVATVAGVYAPAGSGIMMVGFIFLVAMSAGAGWAGVSSLLRETRQVSEVITTIMLNVIALQFVGYLVHGPLQESAGTYPQSDPIPQHIQLPVWLPGTRLHIGLFVILLLCILVHGILFYTAFGFRLRAIGKNPEACRYAGISIHRTSAAVFLWSGGIAGLGGAVEVLGVTHRLFESISPGYGFTAIAVAMLGRLHPLGIIPAALLFGALESGTRALSRNLDVSPVLAEIIQATVILSVVVFESNPLRRKSDNN